MNSPIWLITKPLYEALRGPEEKPLEGNPEMAKAFGALKQVLTMAPALALPDLQKPFSLYMHKRRS